MDDTLYTCNPGIVLREEDDSGTLLFNPDTGDVLVLNPTGRLIWDACAGGADIGMILDGMREAFEDVPEDAPGDVTSFLSMLTAGGFLRSE
jgi:hypothetical protein